MRPAADVRSEQVEANKKQLGMLTGNPLAPTWLVGDGEDCVALFQQGLVERGLPSDTQVDLIFTCPPYHDREVYSTDPRDLSCAASYADFRAKYDGDVMVGCGTIMNTTDAEAACDAGAEFIITPVLVPEVVEWCVQRDIVIIPGCQTPTEAYNAYKLGAPLQKIFPGVAGAHAWVKAVSAALPMLRLNPTSGVDLDNAGDFLMNGAASVGLVAPLFDPVAVQAGDWDQIRANAAKVIGNAAKAGPLKR